MLEVKPSPKRNLLLLAGLVVAVGLALSLLVRPGAPGVADPGDRRVLAVATTSIVADAVRQVGGDRVEVVALMGPGIDPHLYQARESDLRALLEADIVFYIGHYLEGRMADTLARVGQQKPSVALAERIDPALLRQAEEDFPGVYDPHIWFDVGLWMEAVRVVRDALAEVDPVHAEVYQENARRYLTELEELDRWVREQVGRIPPERRVLITAHDAFGYFGGAYGFEVYGLQGVTTATEASAADVRALAELIVQRQIPAIFVEETVPPRFILALQEAVLARGFTVEVGGELYSDALGAPGTPGETYLGMVRHNVETIVRALGGAE
ncbi:metal ABC transporter solute-binding protein, Zn/Mn family [Thermus sediminis]|uniref:metal ABC transporter solute-binding protein, Zn/Mn family n=1 Tax=Thermus sediminis TaxID=1761908 RepID=UPI0018E515C0|nr:zinc ABC transporter substrate-binding protein [Thermus sediminis]